MKKYIVLLTGLFCLVGFFIELHKQTNFLSNSITTDGKVIEVIKSQGSNSTTYSPKIEFLTRDKKQIIFKSRTGYFPKAHDVGDIVSINYQPDNPEHAELNNAFANYGSLLVFGVSGIGLTLFGIFIIKRSNSRAH